MLYSFFIYLKQKFFEKNDPIKKIDNNCVILNLGYLPEDGTIV
jgi:hypothetical protein